MKAALFAALLVAAPAAADPLPKKCAAPSPDDQPCTSIIGTYKIELAPRAKSCVVTKPVTANLEVTTEGKPTKKGLVPSFDAKPLLKALGLKPKKGDEPELTTAIRDGVCCMDLRLYGTKGTRGQRVMIHMAGGATLVGAKADDRWMVESSGDMCGDEDLDVTVTRAK